MSILWLILTSLCSFIFAWFIAQFGAWRNAQQIQRVSRFEKLTDLERVMRYLRRGRYSTERVVRSGFDIVSATARRSIVFLFPKSKKVFSDIDPLTGLQHGPSSYFLMEISQREKKTQPIRRIKKNM